MPLPRHTATEQPTSELRRSLPPLVDTLGHDQRERRARIVDAAVDMLLHVEYDRIQMKDITAAAGVALGTTYRYFGSKDHLLSEAIVVWSQRFPAPAPTTGGDAVEQLQLAYRLAVRAFEPHPTVYDTMAVISASTDPDAIANFEVFGSRQTATFEQYLPSVHPDRRGEIVAVMSAVLDVYLRSWARGRRPIDDAYRILDRTAELLLAGPGEQ